MRLGSKLATATLCLSSAAWGANEPSDPFSLEDLYIEDHVLTPSNVLIYVLTRDIGAARRCKGIDGQSTTPEIIRRGGGELVGWSFVSAASAPGMAPRMGQYAVWIIEKSGLHTTYVAYYILKNCALTEVRDEQRTFDGSTREADANREYNRLLTGLLHPKHLPGELTLEQLEKGREALDAMRRERESKE